MNGFWKGIGTAIGLLIVAGVVVWTQGLKHGWWGYKAPHVKPASPVVNPLIRDNVLRPESNTDDDALARRLIGSWETTFSQNGVKVSGIETYFPDGTSTLAGTITIGGQTSAVSGSAIWKIEAKKLKERITQSSIPDILPVGKTIADDIIKLTGDECITRDSDGDLETRRRVSK